VVEILNVASISCPATPEVPPQVGKRLLPIELTRRARSIADARFPWTEGEWSLAIDVVKNDVISTEERRFVLNQDDINRIKRNIDYFESGVGLCGVWRFANVGEAYPILAIEMLPKQKPTP
jgi:hypothetical protein